jgi:hypothetical protein
VIANVTHNVCLLTYPYVHRLTYVARLFINVYCVLLTGAVPVRETRSSKRMMGNLQTSRFSNLPDPKSQNPVGKSSGNAASGNKKRQPQKSTLDKRSKFRVV